MSQFLHFDKIPRRFMYTVTFEKHWSRISYLTCLVVGILVGLGSRGLGGAQLGRLIL